MFSLFIFLIKSLTIFLDIASNPIVGSSKNNISGLCSTIGGHVLYNEDSKTSIIREVKEELGIDIANDDIKYIGSILFGVPFGDIYYLEKDIDIDNIKLQKEKITKSYGLMFKYLCEKIIK